MKTLHGDAVGPLGVADDSLLAIGKRFCVRGKEYQVRDRKYGTNHPDADGNHKCRFPAQPWPEWMNYGYVPAKRRNNPLIPTDLYIYTNIVG